MSTIIIINDISDLVSVRVGRAEIKPHQLVVMSPLGDTGSLCKTGKDPVGIWGCAFPQKVSCGLVSQGKGAFALGLGWVGGVEAQPRRRGQFRGERKGVEQERGLASRPLS